MAFIGIDLGTSFIKGAVLDLDSLRIEQTHRVPFPSPLPGLPPRHREFDPDAVLTAVQDLVDELAPHAGDPEGIVMCSQMHGLVFTTERGEPRSNLTTWQDQRVFESHPSGRGTYFDVLAERLSAGELRQLGNELRPGQPLGVLFWLAEQGRLPPANTVVASLPDFILANRCGTVPVTESTHAMSHGALNLETMDWHHAVIDKLGLNSLRWPAIQRHGEIVGTWRIRGREVPCYTPVGDYQCAIAGSLLQPGELSLNISTGSQVSLLKQGLEHGDFQTRPFFDGRFLITITHIPAGRALQALVALLSELAEAEGATLTDPWGYIARAAAQAGPSDLRVDLAFFNSACGDHGEIANIKEETLTVGHLFRAAFENMAENYRSCAARLSPERDWQRLVFSGGLAQKFDVLRELICEKFQVGYRLCPTTEDTMLGLMALAMAFTRRTDSVAQATVELMKSFGQASPG